MRQAADADNGIEILNLTKSYSGTKAVDGVSLTVAPGEFLSLLGPSGCGKTTLLRAIAGLATPDSGSIRFGKRTIFDAAAKVFVPAERRNLGMVFQDYALWPHMRIGENVAFPLSARRVAKPQRASMVETSLRRVGLEQLASRFPGELSGGQQQRVALARAIVDGPGILLFDEPLSNLDAGLRDTLGREIAMMTRELGATVVYVTHDQAEALSLSDRIAVMQAGRILCVDTPERLYREPPHVWVASFLKSVSLIPGFAAAHSFQADGTRDRLLLPEVVNGHNGPSTLFLPTSALRVGSATPDFHLSVLSAQFRGDRYDTLARWGHDESAPIIQFSHHRLLRQGESLPVSLDLSRLRLFVNGETGGDIA